MFREMIDLVDSDELVAFVEGQSEFRGAPRTGQSPFARRMITEVIDFLEQGCIDQGFHTGSAKRKG